MYITIYGLFNNVVSSSDYKKIIQVNNKCNRMWGKLVAT